MVWCTHVKIKPIRSRIRSSFSGPKWISSVITTKGGLPPRVNTSENDEIHTYTEIKKYRETH